MKKRKILTSLLLASAAVFSLASCGNTGNKTPDTPGPDIPSETPSDIDETITAITMGGQTYATLADAFAAIPTTGDTSTYEIKIPKGTYEVTGLSYNGTATIYLKGMSDTKYGADVIIKGRGSNMSSMRAREMIEIQGTGNVYLKNLTLESDYMRSETTKDVQAEVLGTDTKGNTVAINCAFKSHQDTLRTAGKAWFYGCYVEGDTDFIWMEQAGSVALYEKCEIVSLYDENAKTHASYVTAPRMGITSKVGKGLVIYNSTVKESQAAKDNGQTTYLARSPWTSGYYNQVAYINTQISDVEADVWYKSMCPANLPQTVIGWKMDKASADSMGYAGNGDIVDADTVAKEFSGRNAIINRIYNTGKLKYEKDSTNYWDLDTLISNFSWVVDKDDSKATLDGEVEGEQTVYKLDGASDVSGLTIDGFKQDGTKTHFVGQAGNSITVPVSGKCYVEIYGYYAGVAEVKADTQDGKLVAFFNNGTTNTELEQDYIVSDANATSVTITAKDKTYITKIVVVKDNTIASPTAVSAITITPSSKTATVGVGVTLTAATNKDATLQSVKWSSSDETVATINEYTGRISFKKAGKVTFTATALDGSGVTGTYEATVKSANWTVSEWYTTDATMDEEEGAIEIGNFDLGSSERKAIKIDNTDTYYEFKNASGQTISTCQGVKLNSKGKFTLSITKNVTLTIICAEAGKETHTPNVYLDAETKATLVGDPVVANGLTTFTYRLEAAGAWTIERGETSAENNPVIYMKAVCDAQPVKSLSYDFSKLENIPAAGEAVASTDEITFTNCLSHDGTQHIIMKENNSVKINLAKGATLTVAMKYSSGDVTVNGTVVALVDSKLIYTATADGVVEIKGTAGKAYIQSITVATYVDTLSYDFSKLENIPAAGEAVASTDEITFTNCLSHDGKQHIIMKENNSVKINLAKGATLTVAMKYSSGDVTVNGTVVALTDSKLVYTAEDNITVEIKGTAGKAYIQSITVTKAA